MSGVDGVSAARKVRHPKASSQSLSVLYVATVVRTHIAEFHLPYLKMLKGRGWRTAIAAQKVRKRHIKVKYTAHGLHFYTGAPLINWLLHAKKTVFVPGVGIDLKRCL